MIERNDLATLAAAAGLDTGAVVQAWDACEAARVGGVKIRDWQRENQEQARLLMLVHQQAEIELQKRSDAR